MIRISRHYISKHFYLLIAGDLAMLAAAGTLVYCLVDGRGAGALWPQVMLIAAMTILILALADLYHLQRQFPKRAVVLRAGLAAMASAGLTGAIGCAIPSLRCPSPVLISLAVASMLGLMAFRLLMRSLLAHPRLQQRVLVLGTDWAKGIIASEGQHATMPYRIVGFLDNEAVAQDNLPPGYELCGNMADLLSIVEQVRPHIILVALANRRGGLPVHDVLECRFRGIQIEDWPSFCEKVTDKIVINSLRPGWLIFAEGPVRTRLTETLRRTVDVGLSMVGLMLAAPAMVLAALSIKVDSPGPILFRQVRVGKDGKVFMLYKFRSMAVDAEQHTGPIWASEDDPRVTRVGRLLRKIRLDETPQMFNVLRGDMSFIGPRPERPVFVDQLKEQIPFYGLRFAVKPGITGWAQVKYPYGSTVEDALEKLQYDLYYIKNMSIVLDLLILLKSVQVVLFARGAR
jgi:sugar transferase (PEP-CTERM system associated)